MLKWAMDIEDHDVCRITSWNGLRFQGKCIVEKIGPVEVNKLKNFDKIDDKHNSEALKNAITFISKPSRLYRYCSWPSISPMKGSLYVAKRTEPSSLNHFEQ